MLASRGITGPSQVFEGNKGFKESISGDFTIDWSAEDLESVVHTIIKKHNAEVHSQSALEAALDIRSQEGFDASLVQSVRLRTFDVAWNIIGGKEEGDKRNITSKEEADHSLPWMLAVALLDGEVTPEQYAPQRIIAEDVQSLMGKVEITEDPKLSWRFPQHMPADLEVTLAGGTRFHSTRDSYQGFHDNPLDWDGAHRKFDALASPFASDELRDRIAETVHTIDAHQVSDLTALLAQVSTERSRTPSSPNRREFSKETA